MDIQIPGYEIERELGDGAMAVVYLATQRSLERKVALKVMAAALANDASFCERFLREGKTLARLSHPHTVTIYDIGNVGSLYYMAMEYLPNGTLKERIAAGLSPEQGLVWLRQIASALGYAHAQGLVHRDVKPANILFRADGGAVLSDFGIAKALDDRTQFTQAGFAVGTPSYMSPEQARGQEIDGRADLYALGVVLYEILTGQLPYVGTDSLSTALAHITQPLPELPIAQGRYQEILTRLLAKDPNDRYPDAAALIAALDRLPAAPVAPVADDNEATQFRPLDLDLLLEDRHPFAVPRGELLRHLHRLGIGDLGREPAPAFGIVQVLPFLGELLLGGGQRVLHGRDGHLGLDQGGMEERGALPGLTRHGMVGEDFLEPGLEPFEHRGVVPVGESWEWYGSPGGASRKRDR